MTVPEAENPEEEEVGGIVGAAMMKEAVHAKQSGLDTHQDEDQLENLKE